MASSSSHSLWCFNICVPSWNLEVGCFHSSLDILGECISPFCINSSHSIQVSPRTCHRSIQTSNSSCILFDRGSLASNGSQHVGRHSPLISHCKRYQGCFSRLGAQGCAIIAFNYLMANTCCVDKVSQKIYQQCLKEWEGRYVQEDYQAVPFPPKLACFLLHLSRVGLLWCTTGIYISAIPALLEPHHHIILSSLT